MVWGVESAAAKRDGEETGRPRQKSATKSALGFHRGGKARNDEIQVQE